MSFIPSDLTIKKWDDIRPFFDDLQKRPLEDKASLEQWLADKSELASFLEEELAWRYINTARYTNDEDYKQSFEDYISNILPHIENEDDLLNKKFIDATPLKELPKKPYHILIRSVNRRIELFRKENIPLLAEMRKMEQEYGAITSKLTITHKGEELTLQQASNFLHDTDRNLRETIYKKIADARFSAKESLDNLFTQLTEVRQNIAQNTGYSNYRDYKFDEMERFDFTVKDCANFHHSIRKTVVPLIEHLHQERLQALKLDSLRPWDLEVDISGKESLKPYSSIDNLIDNTITTFSNIKPEFGEYIKTMKDMKHLDLESRKHKAPGGFNYPLHKTNVPFIFANFTNTFHDLQTMVHEGGHAVHSFLTANLPLVDFKEFPSEVAELASMSMELLSMKYWNLFFNDTESVTRAKRKQLHGVVTVLPWVAAIDKFQHEVYTLPDMTTPENRHDLWNRIYTEFSSSVIDWSGLDDIKRTLWQRQLHLFEVPFYYIEYGFSQLGAVAVWKNSNTNFEKAIQDYKNALSLGYTKTVPEIYKTAGIEFNFSTSYIEQLINFVKSQLETL